jgi:hypothetical protein
MSGTLRLLAAAVLLSAASAASAQQVSLGCKASPDVSGVTYYLIVDFTNRTVSIRGHGTGNATITDRLITWSAQGPFYRLERETGRWEIHNSGGFSLWQCERRKPEKVL